MITLHKPDRLTGKYLDAVLESRHLTTGPMVERLREAMGEFFGADPQRVVLTSSATAAFQAWLDAGYGVYNLEGVIYPPFRWMSKMLGTELLYTDVGGAGQGDGPWLEFHDACQSWTPRGTKWTLVSFFPTKLCSGAEGGALLCPRAEVAEEIQVRANSGIRGRGTNPDWNNLTFGRAGHMTDVQAALNLEALEFMPARKRYIREAWELLRADYIALGGDPDRVKPQPVQPSLFQVEVKDVPEARRIAAGRGVGNQWNFPPNNYITLPCYPMDKADRLQVARVAVEVINE